MTHNIVVKLVEVHIKSGKVENLLLCGLVA